MNMIYLRVHSMMICQGVTSFVLDKALYRHCFRRVEATMLMAVVLMSTVACLATVRVNGQQPDGGGGGVLGHLGSPPTSVISWGCETKYLGGGRRHFGGRPLLQNLRGVRGAFGALGDPPKNQKTFPRGSSRLTSLFVEGIREYIPLSPSQVTCRGHH